MGAPHGSQKHEFHYKLIILCSQNWKTFFPQQKLQPFSIFEHIKALPIDVEYDLAILEASAAAHLLSTCSGM